MKKLFTDVSLQVLSEVAGAKKIKMTTSWLTAIEPDETPVMHRHTNSWFSGVYYFQDSPYTGLEFKNQHVVLTGNEPMRVHDMLKMIAEILALPKDSVKFIPPQHKGHYVRTPYAYQPKLGRKYTPPLHVDLGQGILHLIDEIQQ